ncbi:hypothetical protein BaRGS_00005916 [Batillaria attramentaria]|uniref:Uncharacterized protein n=1 Tax=Batillaria attramentaria TaxID=370345 RepID=A0ABD0LU06_9CAEN|nr:hypothetical protein BaRGS_026952 [Batillaria attramentaria]
MFEHDASSIVWGVSPTMFMVGGVCHVISIAFPHWLATPEAHLGLWNYCVTAKADGEHEECVDITHALNAVDHSWFRAVQGLEIAATVFVLTGLVTGLMRVNLSNNIWQIACGLSAVVAGVMSVSGTIVFAKNYTSIRDQMLSWAFVFNAVSGPLCFLAGPILIVDAILHKS